MVLHGKPCFPCSWRPSPLSHALPKPAASFLPASLHGGHPRCGGRVTALLSPLRPQQRRQPLACPTPLSFSRPCVLPPTPGDVAPPPLSQGFLSVCWARRHSTSAASGLARRHGMFVLGGVPCFTFQALETESGGPTPAVSQV